MKALSIKQPWSWLIANGYKDIENREWPTSLRGLVLIHASKTFDYGAFDFIGRTLTKNKLEIHSPGKFELGGIVGIAEIVGCVTKSESPWFVGKYGFVLINARPLPFTPLRGQLNFFEVSQEVIKQLGL